MALTADGTDLAAPWQQQLHENEWSLPVETHTAKAYDKKVVFWVSTRFSFLAGPTIKTHRMLFSTGLNFLYPWGLGSWVLGWLSEHWMLSNNKK